MANGDDEPILNTPKFNLELMNVELKDVVRSWNGGVMPAYMDVRDQEIVLRVCKIWRPTTQYSKNQTKSMLRKTR